jgi:hypothetical protein
MKQIFAIAIVILGAGLLARAQTPADKQVEAKLLKLTRSAVGTECL